MALIQYLVLKKTPYKESSLVVSGLSPTYGRLDFVVKGAKSISRKKTPVVDLFRIVELDYKDSNRAMHTLYSVELVTDFSALANFPENFTRACRLADFILKNSRIDISCPETFQAVTHILSLFAAGPVEEPLECLGKLVFLNENGFLPHDQSEADKAGQSKQKLLEGMLRFAMGEGELPTVAGAYWPRFARWIDALISYHQLSC